MMEPDEASEVVFQGKFVRVRKRGTWEYVERTSSSGVVAILPITDNNEAILVEQFRIPVGKQVIELPAGIVGDLKGQEKEDLVSAARRELLEETGYEAEQMKFLMEGPSSAGLATEMVAFFRAGAMRKVGPGGGDGSERIVVHTVAVPSIDTWLERKRSEGCLVDFKIYAALYFELLAERRAPSLR